MVCLIGLFFCLNISDLPRYSTEFEMKDILKTIMAYNSNVYYDENNYYPKKFYPLTNATIFIETYNDLKDKHSNQENKNILNDFYYRRGSNWFELGYFIIKPGKKKAIIFAGLYTSHTNYTIKKIELDVANFYKTNTIFKKGIFNKE